MDDWLEADAEATLGGIGADDASDAEIGFAEAGSWTPALGFYDPVGVLRVWIDADAAIERVRLLPTWRTKLKRMPLETAFALAFAWINNHVRSERALAELPLDEVPTSGPGPRLSPEALAGIRARLAEIDAELATCGPADRGRWVGRGVRGPGAGGKVGVSIDEHRWLTGVDFDPGWLEAASPRDIAQSVVQGHRAALAAWRPPVHELGRSDELLAERTRVRSQIQAMIGRGFR